jgi:HEAT repeat protein
MDKYIADLSSNEAKVRNEAAAALESLGEVVIEPLEKMLDGNPSAEARAKAGKIIATVKSRNKTASSPKLQRLRAIDVLARIGDKDAIAVLEQMAEDKTPDVAREAQTALNRLKAGK